MEHTNNTPTTTARAAVHNANLAADVIRKGKRTWSYSRIVCKFAADMIGTPAEMKSAKEAFEIGFVYGLNPSEMRGAVLLAVLRSANEIA